MAAYRLSQAAKDDLARIYRRGIIEFGMQQADRYYDGLISRLERIAADPTLYPAMDHIRAAYRRSVYGAHSIYYQLSDDGLEIVRVLGREDAAAHLE